MCKMLGFCKGKAVPSLKMEKTSKPIVLGDGECTFGPSYWCKNAHTAKQCYAVKYCIEHVWLQKLQVYILDLFKYVNANSISPTPNMHLIMFSWVLVDWRTQNNFFYIAEIQKKCKGFVCSKTR